MAKALAELKAYCLISFDFAKALNKVPHKLLIIHKIKAYKFNVNVVKWIKQWLSNRTSMVLVNGRKSHKFAVTSGVPQGSVLGNLFLLFINECK